MSPALAVVTMVLFGSLSAVPQTISSKVHLGSTPSPGPSWAAEAGGFGSGVEEPGHESSRTTLFIASSKANLTTLGSGNVLPEAVLLLGNGDATLSVRVFGTGNVTSTPSGISCTSGTCSANFTPGTSVTLTAAPGTGFAFSNWSGACSSVAAGSNTCTITVSGSQSASAVFTNSRSVYPIKVSSNSRYTVDQKNQQFLIAGDAPQALIGNVSEADAVTYFSARQALRFNAAWVNLLCDSYTGCNANGMTFDGIAPFTTGSDPSTYDLTTPNPAYFERVDDMLNLAAEYGIVVFLDPIETGGWMTTLKNNGATKGRAYGNYLAQRYKNFPNIVWFLGNDFGTYATDSTGNADLQAVSLGLNDYDTLHLQTGEFAAPGSALDNTLLAPLLSLDGAYTYLPTYDQIFHNYNRSSFKPAFLEEANYEGGHNCTGSTTDGSAFHLRHQEYWSMTSGATGYLTGNDTYITFFSPGWQSNLQTPGAVQFRYWHQFFSAISWWKLVPDQNHALVTSGYGTYATSPCTATFTNNYVTAAITSDNRTAVIYFPESATITVNMAVLSGSVTARWYDPSNNTYATVSGSPFANSGTRNFTPPGNNSAGDPDWLLELTSLPLASEIQFVQVNAATPPSGSSVPIAYPNPQTAGDLNIVVVGWNDAVSSVSSVQDTAGNTYSPATAILRMGAGTSAPISQVIYYSSTIAGGANTVTVTFDRAATYPDIRILEYSGVTSLDVTAGATGKSATASSGSGITASADELIFAADTVYTGNAGPGRGFTSRIITSPDGDMAEDDIVSTAGAYTATAPLTSNGNWVMQMLSFR